MGMGGGIAGMQASLDAAATGFAAFLARAARKEESPGRTGYPIRNEAYFMPRR
jgi:heterodisulfide reductase subunit A-like polyferredoxin